MARTQVGDPDRRIDNPILTKAVFSLVPVILAACSSRASSMFKVVLMWRGGHP
jgi:hypothetical protein